MDPTPQVFTPALLAAIVNQDRAYVLAGAILVDALGHDGVAVAVMPAWIATDVEGAIAELWAATPAGRLVGKLSIVRQGAGTSCVRVAVSLPG